MATDKDPVVPWGDISEGGTVPSGTYTVKLEGVERKYSKDAKKLMYEPGLRVRMPKAMKGMQVYAGNFVIGTDDDPDGGDPETWKNSFGCKNMKRMFKAAGVDVSGGRRVSKMIEEGVGKLLQITVTEDKETKGDFKGRLRNNITGWYADGTKEPGLDGEDKEEEEVPAKRRASDDDDDEPAPEKAKPVDDEDDEPKPKKKAPPPEDDDDAPAPKAKKRPADDDDPPPAKAEAKLKKPIECSLCHKMIERSELEGHLNTEHADE